MDRIAFLKDHIMRNPGDMFARHALALEWIKIGNDAEAEALFSEIILMDPGHVGTYYHLGKLLERCDRQYEAVSIYERGMTQATSLNDQHALRELRGAYEQLKDEMDN